MAKTLFCLFSCSEKNSTCQSFPQLGGISNQRARKTLLTCCVVCTYYLLPIGLKLIGCYRQHLLNKLSLLTTTHFKEVIQITTNENGKESRCVCHSRSVNYYHWQLFFKMNMLWKNYNRVNHEPICSVVHAEIKQMKQRKKRRDV